MMHSEKEEITGKPRDRRVLMIVVDAGNPHEKRSDCRLCLHDEFVRDRLYQFHGVAINDMRFSWLHRCPLNNIIFLPTPMRLASL